jgi:hypothetical protein
MTISVRKKGLGLQKIDEVRIDHEGHWLRKHIASLKNAYGKAPYFREHFPFLEDMFLKRSEQMVDLNLDIIRYIPSYGGILFPIYLLSICSSIAGQSLER